MNNITFQAKININKNLIQKSAESDKFFDAQNQFNLEKIINNVESLSKMKEDSIVDINPRLDSNQLNLITTVTDKMGIAKSFISERSARRMVTKENFANNFITHIMEGIKNVEIVRQEFIHIQNFIKSSTTLKDDNFLQNISKYILASLEKGYNPTKRILYILNHIEENSPNESNIISIKSERKMDKEMFKTSKPVTYFILKNSKGEKKILMHYLLKDPASKLFA